MSCRSTTPNRSTISSPLGANSAVVSTYELLAGDGWNVTDSEKLTPRGEARVMGVCDKAASSPKIVWPVSSGPPRLCWPGLAAGSKTERAGGLWELAVVMQSPELSVVWSNVMLLMLSASCCTSNDSAGSWTHPHTHNHLQISQSLTINKNFGDWNMISSSPDRDQWFYDIALFIKIRQIIHQSWNSKFVRQLLLPRLSPPYLPVFFILVCILPLPFSSHLPILLPFLPITLPLPFQRGP